VLAGRSPECARIERLLAAARAGRGQALLIRGEPGAGKTTLLRFAQDHAAGMVVLEAQGVQVEAELPYAGLSQLLGPVLGEVERLVPPQRRALSGALGLGGEPPSDRFAAYVATLSLLVRVAQERPVLALVDDAHWLDAASAEALAFVIRRLADAQVAVLLATRDGTLPSTLPQLDVMDLEGLDVPAAAALLDATTPSPVATAVLEQLHRQTAGNPLALLEIARLLNPAQLAGSAPLPEPLPVGVELERTFGAQIATLPETTQRALLIAAAHDTGEVVTLARALRGRGLDVSALAEAETARLVNIERGRLEFSHPLMRSACYHRVPAPARRDAHGALAAALAGSTPERASRAWHLAAATIDPSEDVARELETVAFDAQRRAAPAAAGRTLEAAARLTPEPSRRVRRLLAAGHAHHLAGDAETALRLLREALALSDDPIARADIQWERARVEATRGAPGQAKALLVAEAAHVETHDRERAGGMLLEAAIASFMAGRPRETLDLSTRASRLLEQGLQPAALIADLMLGVGRLVTGDSAGGYPLIVRARPLVAATDLTVMGPLATMVLFAEVWVEHYEECRRLALDLLARIRLQGALTAQPLALVALAYADFFLGNWREASSAVDDAHQIADEVGQHSFASQTNVIAALLAGMRGRRDEGRTHAEKALAIARHYGVESTPMLAGWARGLIELADGRYHDAVAALEPAARYATDQGAAEPGVALWAQDLAEAYIRVGRVPDGVATLETLERQAERTGRRLAHAGAARCRGLLAANRDFEAPFHHALAWHDPVPCPFERARTELYFGERLRRARRRSEAREPLRQALASFEALAAEPWAERARRELRATGERARRRTAGTMNDLTAQELQVARLVAEGATNREAAATLFVSPKTIETHLNSIYRKLGVRSRVELGRRLRAPEHRHDAVDRR
jgi:DNA-binding CsgD family transcriptional regulator